MSKENKDRPENKILSPAVGNDEEFKNLGGMPAQKDLDEIHKALKPSSKIEGVEASKSRAV